tara:strand:+ start:8549 stop:8794 length:246 start_codon:yes stop_codon:yes gene_type:complete
MDWGFQTLTNMNEYYKVEYALEREPDPKKIITGIWFDNITNSWRITMIYNDESIIRFFQHHEDCLVFQKEQSDKFMQSYFK